MRILAVSPLGFCSGARRAIDIFRRSAPLESLGQILHNSAVVADLEKCGIRVISSISEARGRVIGIPSHGAPKRIYQEITANRLSLVDATCPTVVKVRETVSQVSLEGYSVVIFGDPLHVEVRGMLGWISGNKIATTDASQVPRLKDQKIVFICQTTQEYDSYLEFIRGVMHQEHRLWGMGEMRIFNTMCAVVKERLEKSIEVARRVDLMLVVGDKSSANTNRLAQVCSQYTKTLQLSEASELDDRSLDNIGYVGITAGTSTPIETVKEIESYLSSSG